MTIPRAALLFILVPALSAQTPQFEVATLKISPPPEGDTFNINLGRLLNGTLTLTNASLSDYLKYAWNITADAQFAGPDWIRSKAIRFDLVAKASPDTPREQIRLMLRSLLAERLGLAVHHEQREISYLALVPAPGGIRMKPAADHAAPDTNAQLGGLISSHSMSMTTLVLLLSRSQRATILDRTSLEGNFEIKLEWSPNQDPDAGPSLASALQEQLGLRLESRKGPLDVLVVDHAEKTPAEN